jgi:hypothetical protein
VSLKIILSPDLKIIYFAIWDVITSLRLDILLLLPPLSGQCLLGVKNESQKNVILPTAGAIRRERTDMRPRFLF